MDLTNFIYDFNLATTMTEKDVYGIVKVINGGRKSEINYDESVSLYDVVSKFNESYLEFMEDINKLNEKLANLGEKLTYEYHTLSDDFASVMFQVINPRKEVFDGNYAILTLVYYNGVFSARADNGRRYADKEFKCKGVDMSEEDIEVVLNIVRKHDDFLEAFRELRNKFVFGNGTTVVFSSIDGDVLDKLTEFTLSFGNSYMNSSDFLEVKFKLGENFKVLFGKSKVEMDDEIINDKNEKRIVIEELLKGIYVNSEKLCKLYKFANKGPILRKKDNDEK